MPKLRRLLVPLAIMAILLAMLPVASAAPSGAQGPGDVSSLERAAIGELTVSRQASTGLPTFISGDVPSGASAAELAADPLAVSLRFLDQHRAAFGLQKPAAELALKEVGVDDLGLTHVRLDQQVMGVPVYGGELIVHYSKDASTVYAINGYYFPGLSVNTKPAVTAKEALALARQAMPGAELQEGASLVIYSQRVNPAVSGDHLTWLVTLYDHSAPARNQYVIDAHSGAVLFTLDLLIHARNRLTYSANNGYSLPGVLRRSEGQGPSGDPDVDDAHDFAGATYDYYWASHSRDSYNGSGATIRSTANYGVNYQNAFWNGTQMVYGDDFAVLDVVAHELTHAVTENEANLIYLNQSGALNESFSDIFGAMVDSNDWLMGEDLPIGAIRSLSNPPAYGDPDHTDDFLCTSSDNGGVHTNSGIQNKAAYLLSTSTSRAVAGRIFYRALTQYLVSNSQFTDARDAAVQSAADLYGAGSSQRTATVNAFTSVGLSPSSTGPECGGCPIQVTTADHQQFSNAAEATSVLGTLYRVRDDVFAETELGVRYTELYYEHTPRIAFLMLKDSALRAEFAGVLRQMAPGLQALADGRGSAVRVSDATVASLQGFLSNLAAADQGGAVTSMVQREVQRIPWSRLAGRTYAEAWKILNSEGVR